MADPRVLEEVLEHCQDAIPSWRGQTVDDFEFDDPKGFSSFTIGVRARSQLDPPAVLYRRLAGKENAILDFETERSTFLLLGDAGIAARCLGYEQGYRIEQFYSGRTLAADDVFDPDIQRDVANELHKFHQLTPVGLPDETFFELLHDQWSALAKRSLAAGRELLPPVEQAMCDDLEQIYNAETRAKVMRCLPDREPVFCHNDTYHGNTFLLDDGSVKLLDFEFSCLNHIAFDFANFFAETVMEHGFAEPPHFRIGEPRFNDDDIGRMIGFYLDNETFVTDQARSDEQERLVDETRTALMLSDFMYAMAALPLALEPMQKIRFIPYSHQRFHKFLRTWDLRFG